jgi:hypothetical protein
LFPHQLMRDARAFMQSGVGSARIPDSGEEQSALKRPQKEGRV